MWHKTDLVNEKQGFSLGENFSTGKKEKSISISQQTINRNFDLGEEDPDLADQPKEEIEPELEIENNGFSYCKVHLKFQSKNSIFQFFNFLEYNKPVCFSYDTKNKPTVANMFEEIDEIGNQNVKSMQQQKQERKKPLENVFMTKLFFENMSPSLLLIKKVIEEFRPKINSIKDYEAFKSQFEIVKSQQKNSLNSQKNEKIDVNAIKKMPYGVLCYLLSLNLHKKKVLRGLGVTLKNWQVLTAEHYLALLSPNIHSCFVQMFVIDKLSQLMDTDMLISLIPFFLACLKYPIAISSPLSEFMVEQAAINPMTVKIKKIIFLVRNGFTLGAEILGRQLSKITLVCSPYG